MASEPQHLTTRRQYGLAAPAAATAFGSGDAVNRACLIRAGATFTTGKLVERSADHGHESGGDDLGAKGRFRLVCT
jgi:hypothetical protein